MRIGIDARMYGSSQTGIGNYVKNLIENIAKIDTKNEYVVFMLKNRINDFDISKISNFKKIPVSSYWYTYSEQTKFPLELYRHKLDLMHFTHFNTPLLYKKPFVVTIHDITPLFFPGHKMNSIIRKTASRAAFKNSMKNSKHIISVSNFTKEQIIKNFSTNANKITTIYEGISKNFQREIKYDRIKEIKEKYGIKKPYIFYVSVWRNHKNVVGLIKAFDILRKKYNQDIQLVLGGKEDPYYPEVRKTWEQLGIGEHIVRPGFISEEELPMFFKGASVVARPSFIEGFTLVEFEAMSQGIPVAASNASCIPELLGNAAIYFDPLNSKEMADVIYRGLTDEKLREDLIKKGYERIKNFSWEKCAKKTLEVYKAHKVKS